MLTDLARRTASPILTLTLTLTLPVLSLRHGA